MSAFDALRRTKPRLALSGLTGVLVLLIGCLVFLKALGPPLTQALSPALAATALPGVLALWTSPDVLDDAVPDEAVASALGSRLPAPAAGRIRFAVIGDYGWADQPASEVAALVRSWNPDFLITTGDNNYPSGAAETIDENVGQYYHAFIGAYTGRYGAGSVTNRFFPALGNHDWDTAGAAPYLAYFDLPGNERYYAFDWGRVRLYALDSDPREPDGVTSDSRQAQWLQQELAASPACWDLVYMHHPPYSSGRHGSVAELQWPYETWGADAVLAGHDHTYERIVHDGFPYFVNGLGGRSIYSFGQPVAGSETRFNADYGAQLVEAGPAEIAFQFITRAGALIDSYSLTKNCGGVTKVFLPMISATSR